MDNEKLTLNVKVGEKEMQFICDRDCTLPYIKESLFQILKYVGSIEDQYLNKEKNVESDNV